MKFELGEKVMYAGSEAEVIEVDHENPFFPYRIEMGGERRLWTLEDSLEKIHDFKFAVGDRVYTPCGGGYALYESERHGEVVHVVASGAFPGEGYYHVELDGYSGDLSFYEHELVEEAKAPKVKKFKVGDKVRMVSDRPLFGKGVVNVGDVGIVQEVRDSYPDYIVHFPRQSSWSAEEKDLELVEEPEKPETTFEDVIAYVKEAKADEKHEIVKEALK